MDETANTNKLERAGAIKPDIAASVVVNIYNNDSEKDMARVVIKEPIWIQKWFSIEHKHANEPLLGTSTFAQATYNCVSLLLGLGILSSPYAIAQSGWILGIIISNVMALTYGYGAYLLMKCMQARPRCRTYQDLAREALGRKAAIVIDAIFYIDIAGTLLGYCISIGDNLVYIFPGFGSSAGSGLVGLLGRRNVMMIIACLCILPTLWLRDLRALSFTSIWSFGSTLLLMLGMLLCATVNHVGFHGFLPWIRPSGVPIAAGLYAFTYGGSTVFPSVYKSMKDPTRFNQVLMLSFAISTVCVGGLGIEGAIMFGEATASQVTLNLPRNLITTKVVLWSTVLNPILKFALVMSPITAAMQLELTRRCQSCVSPATLFTIDTLMRSMALVAIFVVAMTLPYFNYVVALVGSSVTIAICIVLPCIFYLRICSVQRYYSKAIVALISLIIILSTVVSIYGTIISFGGLIDSKRRS